MYRMPRKIAKFIDKKDYYTIGEVAALLNIQSYVLRFWETEFEELKPNKNYKGHRLYTNDDLEIARLIKKLMHEELYTLEGAKRKLKFILQEENTFKKEISNQPVEKIILIKKKLLYILTLLTKDYIK